MSIWASQKTCKTPLGETGCLGNPYFSGCLSLTPTPLTQSVRPPVATYPSLCSTCATYGTPCHARGHQVLFDPPGCLTGGYATPGVAHLIPWKVRISLGVISVLSMYIPLHT